MAKYDQLAFGDILEDIIRKKGVSIAELARRLGYRSKTSLVRILRNESNDKSNMACLQLLAEARLLDDSEYAELERSIEMSLMGADRYDAWQALWALLHREQHNSWSGPVEIARDAVDKLITTCNQAHSANLIVVNCCWPGISSRIFSGVVDHPSFSAQHYFLLNENVAQTIRSVATVINSIGTPFTSRFSSHALRPNSSNGSDGLIVDNLMILQTQTGDQIREHLLMLQPEHGAKFIELAPGQFVYQFFSELLSRADEHCECISVDRPASLNAGHFIDQSETLEKMEWMHNIYMIEPDMCMHCIPPETVIRALNMDVISKYAVPGVSLKALMLRFYRSHSRRYRNLFENPCEKHFVLSRTAMRAFASTGRLSVHFPAMRAFTVSERLEILTECLEHVKNDPHFHMHFWKNEEDMTRDGFGLVEDHGLIAFEIGVGISFASSITQITLKDKASANLLCEYVREEILPKKVIPKKEGLRFMQSLVNELRSMK